MTNETKPIPVSVYTPIISERLLKHAEAGGSLTSFRGEESISEKTLVEWRDTYDDFKEALEIARCKEYAFWERQIREAFVHSSTAMAFDGDVSKQDTFPLEKRINMSFNMLKLQQHMHQKLYGRGISEGNIEETTHDPTEFGSADTNLDITDEIT